MEETNFTIEIVCVCFVVLRRINGKQAQNPNKFTWKLFVSCNCELWLRLQANIVEWVGKCVRIQIKRIKMHEWADDKMCSRSWKNETQMHWKVPKEKEEEKYLPHNVEWICFSLRSLRLTHSFTFVFGVFVVAFTKIILIFNRQQSAEFCDMHENF